MDINFIITVYDREEYWPYLKKVLDNYKIIKSNYVVCYSGNKDDFPYDVRIENLINGGRGNNHHEHACLYADSDYNLTLLGYDFLKKNGVTNWVKLSIDSWLLDENKIINIFDGLNSQNCVYAGNVWYTHINLSTDIFFMNTKTKNLFEDLRKYGPEFLDWLYNNKIPTGFENLMRYMVIPYDHLIIMDREPINAETTRWFCKKLGWTMSHSLDFNIQFMENYLSNSDTVNLMKVKGNGVEFTMENYLKDSGQYKNKYYM